MASSALATRARGTALEALLPLLAQLVWDTVEAHPDVVILRWRVFGLRLVTIRVRDLLPFVRFLHGERPDALDVPAPPTVPVEASADA